MAKQKFEVGMLVTTPAGIGEVVAYKSGWFTVALEEGDEKFRAKDLAPAPKVSMSEQLKKYRARYTKSIGPNMNPSLHNGDDLAVFLEGKSWEQVCALADEVFGQEIGFHAAKYQRLNLGARRMNAGNRLRGAVKRGEWTVPQ